MSYISVEESTDSVLFEKRHWFYEEIEVADSLGFKFKDDCFMAKLNCTSKEALYCFMKYCFGNFIKQPKYQVERNEVYSQLKERYSAINSNTIEEMKKLSFYDSLYKHQENAICQMINIEHNLLAFEQGLGKTITAIAVSELLECDKTLIVCPAICKWNWYNELLKWGIDEYKITIYDSKKKNTMIAFDEKYIVINYDMLKKFLPDLSSKNFSHIILDEAHYIKNCKSKRYGYISNVIHTCKAKLSFLTGTPVWNKPEDLFSYLKLSRHKLGVNYKDFIGRYTHYYSNQWGGISIVKGRNLLELSTKISNFMIRKLKADCLDLPEKIYTKYYFDFLDYSDEYSQCINEIKDGKEQKSADNSIHTLNIIASKSKIKNIIDLAEDIVYSGKKVVLFTSYTEPRRILEYHFADKCVSIYGGQPSNVRRDLIDKFTKDDECKVFIGNMQSAGVGINLFSASDVIFCNFPLTVSELQQCIDRLHRIGQTKNVNVYYTISKGSVDESIYDMIIRKSEDISKVLDGGKETIKLKSAYSKLISNAVKIWKKK